MIVVGLLGALLGKNAGHRQSVILSSYMRNNFPGTWPKVSLAESSHVAHTVGIKYCTHNNNNNTTTNY